MARTNKITVLEVKAVQLVAGLFCIHDILVHHEGRAFGIAGYTLSYLTALHGLSVPCSSKRVARGGGAAYRTGPNFPKRSNSSSAVTL